MKTLPLAAILFLVACDNDKAREAQAKAAEAATAAKAAAREEAGQVVTKAKEVGAVAVDKSKAVAAAAIEKSRELKAEASVKAVEEYGPDRIVLGLPFNMDGTEGPRAKLVREFAAELEKAFRADRGPHARFSLDFHDERLSSFDAEERLKRTGRTHGEKKALRDALAACAILEDFLRAKSGGDDA